MSFEQSFLPTFEPGNYAEQAATNAVPDSWMWSPDLAGWSLAVERWQVFSNKWYGARNTPHGLNPKSLSLEILFPEFNEFPLTILIRKCYVATFKHIWGRAMSSQGRKGIIITGQPGMGKSLLQFYLLVQLLMLKQLVLFTLDGARLYLFYLGKVYTISMSELLAAQPGHRLPEPQTSSSKVFIWSLFDICKQEEPELLLVTPPCLPVQMASPHPSRYQIWDKTHQPLHTGLPLWTRDELVQGLLYQREYPTLLDALREAYHHQGVTDPLEAFPGVRTFLNDLQEDSAPSAEEVLDYLLEAAIDRFGFSARDVFTAVFDFISTTDRHQKAFRISFAELEDAVSALAIGRAPPQLSHRILALSLVYPGPYMNVKWTVEFKSDWVAKCVLEELGEVEDSQVRRQISFLKCIPEAKGLARYFLEPFAHRELSQTVGQPWPLFDMGSDELDSPRFVIDRVDVGLGYAKAKRKVIKFESIADLSTLDNNMYYRPNSSTFPLLDAFTVDFDLSKRSAVLWVIQITTSRSHRGSALGYQNVRSVMAKLKELLKKLPPTKERETDDVQTASETSVDVRYVLVVSKGESKDLEWRFPKGWNKNVVRNDHRGKVYCLEIPLFDSRLFVY